MPSSPHLTLDADRFDPASISPEAQVFNSKLRDITSKVDKWWEIGAAEARRLRREGKSALPGPVLLPSAAPFDIPSRDPGRSVACRVFKPQHDNAGQPRAVFLHIHGGGWVLSDETYQDARLQRMADDHGLVCVSVGYRKAPENPFPAGPHDCFDVAEWLIDNANSALGAPLRFIGGESSGAHLSMLTILHLLQHETTRYRDFRFEGAVLHFGCYSLSWTPSAYVMGGTEGSMILDLDHMNHFRDAFVPGATEEALRDPKISPIFTDFRKLRGKLPPALFTCGTEDCLFDDTLLMSAKWLAAGAECRLEIIPGAAHGYIAFPPTMAGSGAQEGKVAVDRFISEHI